jgi:hypothetical protein
LLIPKYNLLPPSSLPSTSSDYPLISPPTQVKYEELASFSEVLAVGTAASLLPIKSITRKLTSDKFVFNGGENEPGPVHTQLSHALKAIQKGKAPDEFSWCEKVQEPVGLDVKST